MNFIIFGVLAPILYWLIRYQPRANYRVMPSLAIYDWIENGSNFKIFYRSNLKECFVKSAQHDCLILWINPILHGGGVGGTGPSP